MISEDDRDAEEFTDAEEFDAEELLRGLVPGLDACLREVDGEEDPGSPGHHVMRGVIFSLAAGEASDPYERDLLLGLLERERASFYLSGPSSDWPEDIRLAVDTLAELSPEYVSLAIPDYREQHPDDARQEDSSDGSDVQMDTQAFARHMSQRGASAGWSRPGTAPQRGRQPSAGQPARPRVRGVNRRRAKQAARAAKMHRAAMRFRLRGGR